MVKIWNLRNIFQTSDTMESYKDMFLSFADEVQFENILMADRKFTENYVQ